MPLLLEALKVSESTCNGLVPKNRLVLLQKSIARCRVLSFGNRILDVELLQGVERDNHAVYLGQGIVKIPLRVCCRELDFLLR